MSIKLRAIHQAVALLNASGAQFAVQFEEHTFGNAKLARPDPAKPARTRGPVQFHWADLYLPFINSCRPGDVFTHTVGTMDEANSLRSSLSSRLAKMYGPGSYLCSVAQVDGGHKVECLFVERTLPAAGAEPGDAPPNPKQLETA